MNKVINHEKLLKLCNKLSLIGYNTFIDKWALIAEDNDSKVKFYDAYADKWCNDAYQRVIITDYFAICTTDNYRMSIRVRGNPDKDILGDIKNPTILSSIDCTGKETIHSKVLAFSNVNKPGSVYIINYKGKRKLIHAKFNWFRYLVLNKDGNYSICILKSDSYLVQAQFTENLTNVKYFSPPRLIDTLGE